MLRVRFTPRPPLAKVAEVYDEVSVKLRDWRPSWRNLKPVFAASVVQAILTEGRSIGAPWAALKEEYALRKARQGHGRKQGVYSGRLLGEQRRQAAGFSASRLSATYYSRVRHSYPMQRGGGKARYPGRRIMGFDARLEEAVLREIETRADQILAEAAARAKIREGGS